VAELARLHANMGLGCAKPKAVAKAQAVCASCAPVPLPLCAAVPTARVRGATCVLFRVRVLGAGVHIVASVVTLHFSPQRGFISSSVSMSVFLSMVAL